MFDEDDYGHERHVGAKKAYNVRVGDGVDEVIAFLVFITSK